MTLRWRAPGFALYAGVIAFALVAAVLAKVQGVQLSAPGLCVSPKFTPLRAVPWLFVATIPLLTFLFVQRLASKRPLAPVAIGAGPYRAGTVEQSPNILAPRIHEYIRAAFAALALLLGYAQSQTWSCAFALPATCHPKVKRIELVPLGAIDPAVVDKIGKHFRDCYGLPIVVMPPLPLPPSTRDDKRDQSVAEKMMALLPICTVKDPPCDEQLAIGITDQDIYSNQLEWNWTFGVRQSDLRVAVISTFRMATFNGESDRPVKMAAKYIAIDYCGLPTSNDPHSIRYGAISGTKGLDDMDESKW